MAGATLIASPHVLKPFVRRAGEERFRRWFSLADAEELADELADLAEVFGDPAHVPAVVVDDPSDDYLVALARGGRHATASVAVLLDDDQRLSSLPAAPRN